MIQVDFEAQMAKVQKRLSRLLKGIKDLRPIWKKFIPEYQNLIKINFESRGKIMNRGAWPKYWANSTASDKEIRAAKYRKKKGSKPMLVLTGRLKSAATGGPGWNEKLDKKYLKMWINDSTIPYARVHQFGYPRRKIASRPYFFDKDGKLPLQGYNTLIRIISDTIKKDFEK
jgi:phage gpG-like protein